MPSRSLVISSDTPDIPLQKTWSSSPISNICFKALVVNPWNELSLIRICAIRPRTDESGLYVYNNEPELACFPLKSVDYGCFGII